RSSKPPGAKISRMEGADGADWAAAAAGVDSARTGTLADNCSVDFSGRRGGTEGLAPSSATVLALRRGKFTAPGKNVTQS
ncbi:MAG: hypothetical protein ABLT11_10820, partial [Candidatus Acidiferrum sp.]